MAQYTINSSPKTHTTHRVMVGTPLILVFLFSFGFFLVQPADSGQAQPTATNKSSQTSTSNNDTKASNEGSPVVIAPTSLPTLDQVPMADEAAPTGNTSHSANTTSPQAAKTSATSSLKLQSANPNNQSTSSSKPIHTTLSLPASRLTNLLP